MTLEFPSYLCILAFALLSAALKPNSNGHFMVGAFVLLAALSVVVRTTYFDSDMAQYAVSARNTGVSPALLREPIIWFSHRAVYSLVRSEAFAFIVTDLAVFGVLVAAWSNSRLPRYGLFALVLFFPFVLGMQNVYRQWAASVLIIAALLSERNRWKIGLVTAAVLCHNLAIIFAPLIAFQMFPRLRKVLLLGLCLVIPMAVYFAGELREARATGMDLRWFYFAMVAAVSGFIALTSWLGKRQRRTSMCIAIVAIVASLSGAIWLASAASERLSMMALLAVYPSLVIAIEAHRERVFYRFALVIGGFAPILLFAPRDFIMGIVVPGSGS